MAAAESPEQSLEFGELEPLVRLMQETPVSRLLGVLVERLKSGEELRRLLAAGALANARTRAAKDRSTLASFEALAAKSPNGELDIKLAHTYYGYGRYADVVTAARRGLGKGGAKTDANEANMLIGMGLAMQGNSAEALTAFNSVKGAGPGMMKAAHVWSLYAGRKYASAAAARQ